MKKIMFLALMLSVMTLGTASANDADRRPNNSAMFAIGGNRGFVAMNIGNAPGRLGDYRRDAPCCHNDRECKRECRCDDKHGKRGRECMKCDDRRGKHHHHKRGYGRPHPSFHKHHRR